MRIGVCMFYDDKVYYYANINHKINLLYCDKHDLDLIVSNTPQYKNRHAAWESVPLMYNNLDSYDYLIWIDADAFFYTDGIDISQFIKDYPTSDFIFSWDYSKPQSSPNEINTGVYIVKNTPFSKEFLKKWAFDEELYENNSMKYRWDQGVLNDMFQTNIMNIKEHCSVVSYGVLQHFYKQELDSFPMKPFVYHMAGRRASQNEEERFIDSNAYYNELIASTEIEDTIRRSLS